jgi:uncharacterized phage-associated protein
MKPQKLVCFAYGGATVYLEKNLIDDPVEASKYNIIYSSIYHKFKDFGEKEIPPNNLISEIKSVDQKDKGNFVSLLKQVTNKIDQKDIDTLNLLGYVWVAYSKYNDKHKQKLV